MPRSGCYVRNPARTQHTRPVGGILPALRAQWTLQASNTTAGLRGVHNVGGGVVWASGARGTVLLTTDGGSNWRKCAVPDAGRDGASLDLRGVQARDARTAFVLAAGPGGKSRLYRTTDGCLSWKLVLKNRDKEGFWDALYLRGPHVGWLLGDPVRGMFTLFATGDGGSHWIRQRNHGLRATPARQSVFAASNSSLGATGFVYFVTGGTGGAQLYSEAVTWICLDDCPPGSMNLDGRRNQWRREAVPVGRNTGTSGIFSIGARTPAASGSGGPVFVAVGGDYSQPDETSNTAAFKLSRHQPWTAATVPPHGYRSSVQWSESLKAWITVGPNGTDISTDDGRTWRALEPSPGEPIDAGRNWNALSLPFAVGPNGRSGRLR